jgi:hypothetical protein
MIHNKDQCRLCFGATKKVFAKKILKKHVVDYFVCSNCGSMQTEKPYWLKEAYEPANDIYDTGQVVRSLMNAAFLMAMHRALDFRDGKVLDYGGGSGLTVRLLRDVGINAWAYDLHGVPRLAAGFQSEDLSDCKMINLCEVAEHFDEPARYIEKIFSADPGVTVIQTVLFDQPDENWYYLGIEHGQHVFFYSVKALDLIANKYDRVCVFLFDFVVLLKKNIVDGLLEHSTGKLKPDHLQIFQDRFFELFKRISDSQYYFAMQDNQRLSGNQS